MRFKEALLYVILIFLGILIVTIIKISNNELHSPSISIQIIGESSVVDQQIIDGTLVQPTFAERIPELSDYQSIERKSLFIKSILPPVLIVHKKYDSLKHWVQHINASTSVNEEDSLKLSRLIKKYKARNIEDLEVRLSSHPISITLAQAAIESGWGTSRFCTEGNNIFGVWSFNRNDNRMVAGETRAGNHIYVKKYDNILFSIDDYCLNLSRSYAFEQFRKQRAVSENPYELIWFLQNYSEKRFEYVVMLRNVMHKNNLSKYDQYTINEFDPNDETWTKLLAN